MNTNRLPLVLTIVNLALLLVVLIQGRIIATQTIPDVLRVRAFELVDESGQVRAQLNIDETNGEVIFRLRDQAGTIRVKMGASENGSGLVLINERTEPGIQMYAQQDATSLTLTGQDGAEQVIEP